MHLNICPEDFEEVPTFEEFLRAHGYLGPDSFKCEPEPEEEILTWREVLEGYKND